VDELPPELVRFFSWRTALVVVAIFLAVRLLRRLLKGPAVEDTLTSYRSCSQCGWVGRLSRHKARCPKCGFDFGAG
jgi:predicted Zn-ribbon and HTH transcriptional regulator